MKILIYSKKTKLNDSLLEKLLKTHPSDVIITTHTEKQIYQYVSHIDILILYTNCLIDIEKTLFNIRNTNKNVYVLAVDDMSDDFITNKAIDLGIDDYISSKSTLKQLFQKITAIHRVISRYKYSQNRTIIYKDLSIDVDSYSVIRGNKQINLTKKEFLLLQYFLENKNKVLTRTMIAERLWDIDTIINSNIVDVYINFLRRKIDSKFETKLIKTVRGVGYIIK